LPLAVAAAQAVQMIGLPEGRIPLAQAAVYLAGSPKSNSSYLAINRAFDLVENEGSHSVPLHLKDSSYSGAKKMGHGAGYLYPHDYPGHHVRQDYLPPALVNKKLYYPASLGAEEQIKLYLEEINPERYQSEESYRQDNDDD
jgi:putative ATPase